jgi:hypothetical protein
LPIHPLYVEAISLWSWVQKNAVAIEAVALVVICLVDLGVFFWNFKDKWTRPKLHLDFVDDSAHVVRLDSVSNPAIAGVWVRVRATNLRPRLAKQCRPFLTKLETVDASGKAKPTNLADSLILRWPGNDTKPRDIPNGVEFYVDVVFLHKSSDRFNFLVERLFGHYSDLQHYKGTYRFHILLTGDDAYPAQCAIDVTYNGDWEKVVVRKAA